MCLDARQSSRTHLPETLGTLDARWEEDPWEMREGKSPRNISIQELRVSVPLERATPKPGGLEQHVILFPSLWVALTQLGAFPLGSRVPVIRWHQG